MSGFPKCTFIINFNSIEQEYPLKNYQFLDISGSVEGEDIKKFYIPDKYFENDGCSIRVCFRLFSSDEKQELKFYFDLFHGENYATCLFEDDGKLFEIDFKNQNTPINLELQNKKKIINYDTNNTKNRKRYLLINYSNSKIKFNDKKINLMDFLPPNPHLFHKNSIKLAVYSLEKNYIFSNYIEPKEIPNDYSYYYCENFPLINGIQEDVKSLINSKKGIIKENLLKKITINIPKINLNLSKKKLEQKLSKEEYLTFEINMTLKKLLSKFLNQWENDLNLLKEIYDCYSKIEEKIKNDDKLKLYQKIILLNQYYATSEKFKFINDFVNSKFNYYIISYAEPNSVLGLTQKFFSKFVENLSEEHKAFDRLLDLDGEIGFLNGESYFCFNMENLVEVRTHLRQKMPEIITTYYNEDNDNFAFSQSFTGYTTININSFEKFQEIDIMKNLDENYIIIGKNYASKLITYLLHEVPGHIKFSFSNACKNNSPSKFINESNEICQLFPENDKSKDKNKFKILSKNQMYDSGSFFELLYDKIGNYYISQILDSLSDYGKLVDRVDLLLENLDIFKEYIKMHFLAKIFKINLDNYINLSVEEEISFIKESFKNKNIDYEEFLNYNADEDSEEENSEEQSDYNESNNVEKKNSINNDNRGNGKSDLKDKIKSTIVLRNFSKKFPHLKEELNLNKKPKEEMYSLKDQMIRNLFIHTVNLRDDFKKIHDDPNLSEEMKWEYYRILNTVLSNDCK